MPDMSIAADSGLVQQMLQRAPQQIETAAVGTLEDGSTLFLAIMKNYPPALHGSRYIRTNTLMRSWNRKPITRTSTGWQSITGSNGNMAPYNRRVQSRQDQARVFRGRWLTAEDAIEQQAPQIQRFADARMRTALEGWQ